MTKGTGYKIIIAGLLLIIIAQWLFIFTRPRKAALKIPAPIKGRIAIVVDDWGYNLNNLHILEQIRYPLTCAILPELKFSTHLAKELHTRGFQVILHLPLEPHEEYRLEKNTITTSMGEETVKNIIGQDLDSLVYAKGASNHMGSRATENLRTMTLVFNELKKRQLFFLDSMVTSKSICSVLARKMGLMFAKRDVFLDNKEEYRYIRGQIDKLKAKARIYGEAIGIGHDRKRTLEVLAETMPQLEKEGFKFVFVSELVK